jgi:hypothetical protein
MGRQAVEEPAIMADHHSAAGEIFQCLFEGAQGINVQIIGWFVEQDDIGA